jgi:hypothetical protein
MSFLTQREDSPSRSAHSSIQHQREYNNNLTSGGLTDGESSLEDENDSPSTPSSILNNSPDDEPSDPHPVDLMKALSFGEPLPAWAAYDPYTKFELL